jgi:hypothetical protein
VSGTATIAMGSALGKRLQSGGRSEPSSETFAALCSANLGGKGSGDLEAQGSVKKTARQAGGQSARCAGGRRARAAPLMGPLVVRLAGGGVGGLADSRQIILDERTL